MAGALEWNNTLIDLDLSINNICDEEGAQALVNALKGNDTLIKLGLGGNSISSSIITINQKNKEVMREYDELLNCVHERQMAVSNMLKGTIEGNNFPKYFAILPADQAKGFDILLEFAIPTVWVSNNAMVLVFFCPITLRAVIGPNGKANGAST